MPSARNDNFNYTYALKNNFAILNLVKSFLTSINFDSLSRKIKIPCLVINFNFYTKEDIRMKNIKTILIAVLSFMLLFSISCKNDDKTGGVGDIRVILIVIIRQKENICGFISLAQRIQIQ